MRLESWLDMFTVAMMSECVGGRARPGGRRSARIERPGLAVHASPDSCSLTSSIPFVPVATHVTTFGYATSTRSFMNFIR